MSDPWAEHNARVARENQVNEVIRGIDDAVEEAAEKLARIGFTADEAGELLSACLAEAITTADWSGWFDEDGHPLDADGNRI